LTAAAAAAATMKEVWRLLRGAREWDKLVFLACCCWWLQEVQKSRHTAVKVSHKLELLWQRAWKQRAHMFLVLLVAAGQEWGSTQRSSECPGYTTVSRCALAHPDMLLLQACNKHIFC
jgi:hypothetical protein